MHFSEHRPHLVPRASLPFQRTHTDNPMAHLWALLSHYAEPTGAGRLIARLSSELSGDAQFVVDESKAQDVAFAIRTARDYFQSPSYESDLTTKAVLYYYGLFWLMAALAVADPTRPLTLSDVEEWSKTGHGLKNAQSDSADLLRQEYVYISGDRGFLAHYLAHLECPVGHLACDHGIPPDEKRITLESLLGRVPEVRAAWDQVAERAPFYVPHSQLGTAPEVSVFSDSLYASIFQPELDARLTQVLGFDVANPPPGYERLPLGWDGDGYKFRLSQVEWTCPTLYHSAWCSSYWIAPYLRIDGLTEPLEPLFVHLLTLYLLSIMVRYRPQSWRRVMEGDRSHYRPLLAQYLMVVERIVPNLALNRLTLRDHVLAPPAYMG